jgi:hypothetical protein
VLDSDGKPLKLYNIFQQLGVNPEVIRTTIDGPLHSGSVTKVALERRMCVHINLRNAYIVTSIFRAYNCSDAGGGLLIMHDSRAITFKLAQPDINALLKDITQKFDQHIAKCRLEPDDYVTVVTGCTLTGDYHAALIKPRDDNVAFTFGRETETVLSGPREIHLFHCASQGVIETNGHRHETVPTDCEALQCSDNKNQCIFLNIMPVKRKRWRGFKIRAAAEPEDLEEDGFDDFSYSHISTSGFTMNNADTENGGFELIDEYGDSRKKVGILRVEFLRSYFRDQDTWNDIFDWLFTVS